jgi:hypothetical protein
MHNYQQVAQQNHSLLGVGYRFAPEFQVETAYLEKSSNRR